MVVMTGEPPFRAPGQDSEMQDYRSILTGQELECWLDTSAHEVFLTFELHNSTSVQHLPPLKTKRVLDLKADIFVLQSGLLKTRCRAFPKTSGGWLG